MRSACVAVAVVVASFASGASAGPLINFESFPDAGGPTYTEQGVTFRSVVAGGMLGQRTGSGSPNNTKSILEESSPRENFRADIAGGAGFVAVDLGDLNQDPDLLFLEAYNAAGTRIGYAEELIDGSFVGFRTLSVTAPNISYVIFGGRPPATGGNSVYADNFTYDAVPEPGALGLAVVAGAGLLVRRRRAVSPSAAR